MNGLLFWAGSAWAVMGWVMVSERAAELRRADRPLGWREGLARFVAWPLYIDRGIRQGRTER